MKAFVLFEAKQGRRPRVFWRTSLGLLLLGVGILLLGLLPTPTAQAQAAQVGALPPTALIVDDQSPQFRRFGPSANWRAVIVPGSADYYADGMLWTANTTDQVENYATWTLPTDTLTVTFAITYEVFAFMPRNNADTQQAEYQIIHGGVTDTQRLDQSRYFAEWVSLGKYRFSAAGDNLVQLSDKTGERYGTRRVGFDALAFVAEVTSTLPVTGGEGFTATAHLPALLNGPPQILSSTSRYVSTLNPQAHYGMGCASGRKGERGTVVLTFGQPAQVGFGYGAFIYDFLTLASTQQIAEAVKGFARGYYACSSPDAHLNLAVGTSNYLGETNANHGKAWAGMVNSLNEWLHQPISATGISNGRKLGLGASVVQTDTLAARISIFGGNDIEPSWNSVANTRSWVDGYGSVAVRPFLNFGSCDGCPTPGNPTAQPNNGWTLEDIWYVSYGASQALPFPEIYAQSGINARQWQYVSLYAHNRHGARMDFAGLLTQYQACQDREAESCRANGLDITPQQAWEQFQATLNGDQRTAQSLPMPSDITWQSN